MARTYLLVSLTTCVGSLLAACGQSQEDSSQFNRTLGGVKEGAPLGPATFDPGILQDGGTYQPPKAAAGAIAAVTGKAPVGVPAAGTGPADAETQVRAVVAALRNAVKDGEADIALRLFAAEQAKPLVDNVDVLFNTYEKVDLLRRFLKEKLEPAVAERLVAGLVSGDAPKSEVLDAEHASVTPNPAALLFGPTKAGAGLQLLRKDKESEWKFQLAAPLTDADVEAIKSYHEGLQAALDEIVDWLDQATNVAEEQIKTALANVVQGKSAGLDGTAASEQPDAPKGGAPATPSKGRTPPKVPGQGG